MARITRGYIPKRQQITDKCLAYLCCSETKGLALLLKQKFITHITRAAWHIGTQVIKTSSYRVE